MSSLLAVEPPAAATQRLHALPTIALARPRRAAEHPLWAVRTEHAIRAVGRFGLSPSPVILAAFAVAIEVSLRT